MGALASFVGVDQESQAGVRGYVCHCLRRLLEPFIRSGMIGRLARFCINLALFYSQS